MSTRKLNELPLEIINNILLHIGDDVGTLRSLTLSCRALCDAVRVNANALYADYVERRFPHDRWHRVLLSMMRPGGMRPYARESLRQFIRDCEEAARLTEKGTGWRRLDRFGAMFNALSGDLNYIGQAEIQAMEDNQAAIDFLVFDLLAPFRIPAMRYMQNHYIPKDDILVEADYELLFPEDFYFLHQIRWRKALFDAYSEVLKDVAGRFLQYVRTDLEEIGDAIRIAFCFFIHLHPPQCASSLVKEIMDYKVLVAVFTTHSGLYTKQGFKRLLGLAKLCRLHNPPSFWLINAFRRKFPELEDYRPLQETVRPGRFKNYFRKVVSTTDGNGKHLWMSTLLKGEYRVHPGPFTTANAKKFVGEGCFIWRPRIDDYTCAENTCGIISYCICKNCISETEKSLFPARGFVFIPEVKEELPGFEHLYGRMAERFSTLSREAAAEELKGTNEVEALELVTPTLKCPCGNCIETAIKDFLDLTAS